MPSANTALYGLRLDYQARPVPSLDKTIKPPFQRLFRTTSNPHTQSLWPRRPRRGGLFSSEILSVRPAPAPARTALSPRFPQVPAPEATPSSGAQDPAASGQRRNRPARRDRGRGLGVPCPRPCRPQRGSLPGLGEGRRPRAPRGSRSRVGPEPGARRGYGSDWGG